MQPGRTWTARVGVLTILDEEFDAAEQRFGPMREIGMTGCFECSDGARDLVLMQAADRSNVAADEAVRDMIEQFRPEVVVVCGIGGGIAGRDAVATGDVVVASYLHYSELRKLSEAGDHDRYLAYDQPSAMLRQRHVHPIRRLGEWKTRIEIEAPEEGHQPKVIVGPILAGEKVLGRPEHHEHQRAVSRFTDAIAVDMESYGAARAMHTMRTEVDYNPLLLVVRGISDLVHAAPETEETKEAATAGQANNAQRKLWKAYACAVAAAFTAAMVERLTALPDRRQALRTVSD